MGRQASREHRLSKDRVYPSVGDWDAPKTARKATIQPSATLVAHSSEEIAPVITPQHETDAVAGADAPSLGSIVLPELCLEFCERTDPRYKEIRDRHYVPNRGAQGRQLHYLIHYKGEIVGIISAGSAIWARKDRDKFFGITKQNRAKVLGGIVNMTVFRLENHERNLASRVIALWTKVVPMNWKDVYGVEVFGFETLIEPMNGRTGASYKAAGWINVTRETL